MGTIWHVLQYWPKWVDPHSGHRQDSAHKYLLPKALNRSLGLTVLCEHKVNRIIIEDGRASGVEVIPSVPSVVSMDRPTESKQHPCTSGDTVQLTKSGGSNLPADSGSQPMSTAPNRFIVKARLMVVLSAGPLNTPLVLERSGIGGREVLHKAGTTCVVDLPGVGENFQDHLGCFYGYRFDKETLPSHQDYLRSEAEALKNADVDFKQGKGPHATNFVEVGGKVRPAEDELRGMGPEFCKLWDTSFRNAEDKPLL